MLLLVLLLLRYFSKPPVVSAVDVVDSPNTYPVVSDEEDIPKPVASVIESNVNEVVYPACANDKLPLGANISFHLGAPVATVVQLSTPLAFVVSTCPDTVPSAVGNVYSLHLLFDLLQQNMCKMLA